MRFKNFIIKSVTCLTLLGAQQALARGFTTTDGFDVQSPGCLMRHSGGPLFDCSPTPVVNFKDEEGAPGTVNERFNIIKSFGNVPGLIGLTGECSNGNGVAGSINCNDFCQDIGHDDGVLDTDDISCNGIAQTDVAFCSCGAASSASYPITKVEFKQTILAPVGACTKLDIELKNASDVVVNAPDSDMQIWVGHNRKSGQFYTDASCTTELSNTNSNVTIPQGSSTAAIYWKDTQAGVYELGVRFNGLGAQRTSVTIHHRAFVTHHLYNGEFGAQGEYGSHGEYGGEFMSTAEADAECRARALEAGLGDTGWRAVLSSTNDNAFDRIKINAPVYVDKDSSGNVKIADDQADFWDGSLDAAINYDQYQHVVTQYTEVWTGSDTGGIADQTCSDWQTDSPGSYANEGSATASSSDWIDKAMTGRCSETKRLYCVDGQLTHRVFVSQNTYDGDRTSIFGFRSLCNDIANVNQIGGEWIPIMSNDIANFLTEGLEIKGQVFNTNGDKVADTLADLQDGTLDAAIKYNAQGNAITTGTTNVWTGLNTDATAATDHCDRWSSDTTSFSGAFGDLNSTTSSWMNNGADTCDQRFRIYCLEDL